ncbi:hypothetical protein KIPB_017023, partial [Kipferlia bialata]
DLEGVDLTGADLSGCQMQSARVGAGRCEGAVFPEGDQSPTLIEQRARFEVSAYASETVVKPAKCPNAGRGKADLVTVIVPPSTASFTLVSRGGVLLWAAKPEKITLINGRDQRVTCTRNDTDVTLVGYNGNTSTHPCTEDEEARVILRVYTGFPEQSPTMTIVYE